MSTVNEAELYVYADRVGGPQLHAQLLRRLATVLDPLTRDCLDTEVHVGSRCWEIGAGAGTIAAWLAEQVGPTGHVLASDTDPSHITARERLTVLRHDIVTDPMPGGPFDLIHARLVFGHLAERDQLLHRLAALLSNDGALVVEQFDPELDRAVIAAPTAEARALFTAYHHALLATLSEAGTDPGWGRLRAHQVLTDAGLDVEADWRSQLCRGGEPGCLLIHDSAVVLRDRLVDTGMTAQQLDQFAELLHDPRLVIRSNTLIQVVGRTRGIASLH